MPKFASGKNSYAISDRSGFRYRYKDMRKEWTGALVGRDEFESKQPQLGPFRKVIDAQALKDARPDQDNPVTPFEVRTTNGIIYLGNGNWSTAGVGELPSKIADTDALLGQIGTVTILTSGSGDVIVNPTGVQGAVSINSVTIIDDAGTFDSTSETLDSTAQTYDEG